MHVSVLRLIYGNYEFKHHYVYDPR